MCWVAPFYTTSQRRCSGKMVLYWSSKFCIFESFTNIQSHRRFNLGFWNTSEQDYRELQHGEKILAKFQSQLPEKWFCISLTKFDILKHCTNIQSLRRLELRFWQTSKQIYRKLQYEEKLFSKFQGLPRFIKKTDLHSSRKFYIFEICNNVQSLKRFQLGFSEIFKQVYSR